MLVDFQTGHKLFFTVAMADESYRIAFIDAVARTGVPPANPLYFSGSPAPKRYYYFWYVLCAAVVKLAHVTARQAYVASCIWAGFGLLVTVRLYAVHFFRWERKQRWIALGLLLVSGAGIVPALGNAVLQPSLNGDIEWWSVDPIDAWPDSLLWVPHHVASVLCCLLVFLFLWRTLEPLSRNAKCCAVVFGGYGLRECTWSLGLCGLRLRTADACVAGAAGGAAPSLNAKNCGCAPFVWPHLAQFFSGHFWWSWRARFITPKALLQTALLRPRTISSSSACAA